MKLKLSEIKSKDGDTPVIYQQSSRQIEIFMDREKLAELCYMSFSAMKHSWDLMWEVDKNRWRFVADAIISNQKDFISIADYHKNIYLPKGIKMKNKIIKFDKEEWEYFVEETMWHLQLMYPKVWEIMGQSCRKSLRNFMLNIFSRVNANAD